MFNSWAPRSFCVLICRIPSCVSVGSRQVLKFPATRRLTGNSQGASVDACLSLHDGRVINWQLVQGESPTFNLQRLRQQPRGSHRKQKEGDLLSDLTSAVASLCSAVLLPVGQWKEGPSHAAGAWRGGVSFLMNCQHLGLVIWLTVSLWLSQMGSVHPWVSCRICPLGALQDSSHAGHMQLFIVGKCL